MVRRNSHPAITNVSVIIINWNTRDHLKACLETLLPGEPPPELEVIVVDNDSSDGSADLVGRSFPSVVLVRNDRNLMFAGGVNSGLRHARGKYFFILNPDVLITAGTVAKLAAYMESRPDVAAVSPALYYPTGEFQSDFFLRLPSLTQLILFYTPLIHLTRKSAYLRSHYFEAVQKPAGETSLDQLPGGCMLVSRAAVDAAGVMDEDFVLYYEDVDWCVRLSRYGRLMLYPEASAIHHGGGSHEKEESWIGGRFKTSMLLYYKKHLGPVSFRVAAIVFFTLAGAGLLVRSIEKFLPFADRGRVANRIQRYKFFFQEYRQRSPSFKKY